jgi:hypothetical protein
MSSPYDADGTVWSIILIVGSNDLAPGTSSAVIEKAKLGNSFGMPTELETKSQLWSWEMVPGI